MKNIVLLSLLLPVAAAAQKGFAISGTITGLKEPAVAYLDYGKTKDSVEIENGRFEFKGSANEPVQAFLAVKRASASKKQADYTAFWLENSKISVTAIDSIKKAVVKGSVADRENSELESSVKPNTNVILRLMKEADNKPVEARKRVISDSIQLMVKRIKDIRTKFAETHPNSFMGLYVYHINVLDSHADPVVAEPIFNRFSPELKSSPLGLRTIEKLQAAKRRQAGVKVTDFTQKELNDKAFTLSSLRGKYVLVDFWASWCKPCRAENPNLLKAYQQLKDKNFEIVAVSLDENKAAWANAVKMDGMPWIQVSDLKGWQNEVAVKYGVTAVPQNLLINPEGLIIATNLRGKDLTEKLAAFIK